MTRDVMIDSACERICELEQEPCDKCSYNHTSICGNCKRYDEFEEVDYFVQEHKKIPVTLDLTSCDDKRRKQMIRKTLYCDRCGKECEQSRFAHYLLFKRKYILTLTNEEKLDLCQECYDSLTDWFQTGLNKVGKEKQND